MSRRPWGITAANLSAAGLEALAGKGFLICSILTTGLGASLWTALKP
ncbi:hypothetical protein [Albimonas donghaensis]|nr:hypothetical protein [Albimonas donghaensis]